MNNKNNENNEKNNKKFYIIKYINELPNILKSIPFDKGNTLINELYELIKSIYNKSTTLNSNILHYNNNLDTILEQFKEIIVDNENIKSKIDVLKNEINNINKINNTSIKINNTLKSKILLFKSIQNSIKICIYYKHRNINKYIDLIKIKIANIINKEYNKLNKELNEINKKKDKCYYSKSINNLISKINKFQEYNNDLNKSIQSKKNNISTRIIPIIKNEKEEKYEEEKKEEKEENFNYKNVYKNKSNVPSIYKNKSITELINDYSNNSNKNINKNKLFNEIINRIKSLRQIIYIEKVINYVKTKQNFSKKNIFIKQLNKRLLYKIKPKKY